MGCTFVFTSPRVRGEVEGAKRPRVRGLSAILGGEALSTALKILPVEFSPAETPPHPNPLPAGGEREEKPALAELR
jgi:hypothetical protein